MHVTRHAPLAPTTTHLYGRALRQATLAALLRAGRAISIAEIESWISALGRQVDAAYPAKAIGDALRYEVQHGRVRRVARGRYAAGRISGGMHYRVLRRFGAPVAS